MYTLILLASGKGTRLGLPYNKIFHEIDNESIIERSIKPFLNHKLINEIIIVVNKSEEERVKNIIKDDSIIYVYGGEQRYDSVFNGLQKASYEFVLIHDAARCFLTKELLDKLIDSSKTSSAAFLGVKSKDTIHIIDNDNVVSTLPRNNTYLAQTPQVFKTKLIKEAYNKFYLDDNSDITDDVMLFKKYTNYDVKLVESSYDNIKITTIEDLK